MNNSMTLFPSPEKTAETAIHAFESGQLMLNGFLRYFDIFIEPLPNALDSFLTAEHANPAKSKDDFGDFTALLEWNIAIAEKNIKAGMDEFSKYAGARLEGWTNAWMDYLDGNTDSLRSYFQQESATMKHLVKSMDNAISEVENDFGFKLSDENAYKKVAETKRFDLYQVMPLKNGVKVREHGKPVLLIPPYVLGPNILAFLPDEGRSYAHGFANKGIPTYIRIVKNINEHPAVQTMKGEDDVLDTKFFCDIIKNKHGKAVSLNGYCQGGFMAMAGVLTGELDGIVDTLITCVAPLDGTRSHGMKSFLSSLPPRYRRLEYATKKLKNGNSIIDGKLMGWVFKLKNMEKEAPVVNMISDLKMIQGRPNEETPVPKIAAAINRWICGDRTDLPLGISELSFASYTIPIDPDGNLPFSLFGKKLNLKYIEESGLNFQICYAEKDDLVETNAALAPLDFIKAEITAFPKGHGAIATSWSKPDSPYPLDGEFNGYRGPVKFHLDIEEKIEERLDRNAA